MERKQLVIERNFTSRYLKNYKGIQGNDIHILTHLNGLHVITLAKSNYLLKKEGITCKFDHNVTKCSGRKRTGTVNAKPRKRIISFNLDAQGKEVSGPMRFDMCPPMKGVIMETNSALECDISLLFKKPETDGYLMIIDGRGCEEDNKELLRDIMTVSEYEKSLADQVEL